MDLRKVLSLLVREFDVREIPYALIGGFAMGALGAPRSTIIRTGSTKITPT